MNLTNYIDIIGSVALVAGAVLVIISRSTKDTIKQQSVLIDAQKDRLDLLERQHIENAKKIGQLEGQLNAYKELPLKQIASSLKSLSENQRSIIDILNKNFDKSK